MTYVYQPRIKQQSQFVVVRCWHLPSQKRRQYYGVFESNDESQMLIYSINGVPIQVLRWARWSDYIQKNMDPAAFEIDTRTHHLSVRYQPASIAFLATDKSTGQQQTASYNQSTLPQQLREESQHIQNLYGFLRGKKPEEIVIGENQLSIRTVQIFKEHWHHLQLYQEEPIKQNDKSTKKPRQPVKEDNKPPQEERKESIEAEKMMDQKNEAVVPPKPPSEAQLARQTRTVSQADLVMMSQRVMDQQINRYGPPSFKVDGRGRKRQNKVSKSLKLSVSDSCSGASKYSFVQGLITKESEEIGVLLFNQQVNCGESVNFGVRVESQLTNNWLMLGIMPAQMARRPFCYCINNVIAFSGSVATLFVQMQSMDLNMRPRQGDMITVEVNGKEGTMAWYFNRQLMCVVRIPRHMNALRLQPYLMLAHCNDQVSLI